MQFEGAVIREQNVTFAIVIVKKHVLDSNATSESVMRSYSRYFPGMPIVLMAQDHRGRPTYYGRRDISNYLARVPLRAIPWKKYTVN